MSINDPWGIVWRRTPHYLELRVFETRYFGRGWLTPSGWTAETDRGDTAAPGFTEEQIVSWLKERLRAAAAIGELTRAREAYQARAHAESNAEVV